MRSIARKIEPQQAYQAHQEVGRVARADGASFAVASGSEEHDARRAVSCLVQPEVGDEVVVSVTPSGRYILAILERRGTAARLVLDGDLSVSLPSGRFTVDAADGVSVVSGTDVGVVSPTVDVRADRGSVVLESLSFLGATIEAEVGRAKVVATLLESVAERVSQRCRRAFRFVTEIEQLRAHRIDYTAEQTMSLRAENTVLTAQELVKIDGEQIHVG
jgi:hypothetical protein